MAVATRILTVEEITEIWWLLREPGTVRQEDIAKQFGLSVATVSRIANGKSHRTITERLESQFSTGSSAKGAIKLKSYADGQINVLALARTVKTDLYLDHDAPIYWGWYDWIGIKQCVLTDGAICWVMGDCGAEIGIKLCESGITDYPVFADQCCELAALPLLDLMRQAFDTVLSAGDCVGDVVSLAGGNHGTLQVRRKYMDACQKHKLVPYEVTGSDEFIYLVKVKRTPKGDDELLLAAAVATLQE